MRQIRRRGRNYCRVVRGTEKSGTATMITVPRKTAAKMHPRTALIMVPTRARTACRTRARTVPGIALKTSIRTRQRMITAIVTD